MGYRTHAFKAISWMTFLRFSTRGISFLRLAILARILTPSQFGIFGIAILALSFLEILTETGINVFLVQRKEGIDRYISSAWIVSIIRGFIIAIIIIFLSPLIVRFFNSPESQHVIVLISLVPIIRGFINPSIIKIQKEIEFHKEFYLRSILLVMDTAIVIVAALILRSAESFAIGLIATAVLEVILSFVFFKPLPKLIFEPDKVFLIIKKGIWITFNGIFSYFAENSDNIAVGRILGTSSLGYYQVAYRISTLTISEIAEVVNKVTFPVYSKFSNDKERVLKAFSKVTLVSSSVALVVGFVIFIFAEPIVTIIAGKGWLLIIPIVKVLAIYGVLRTIFGNFVSVYLSFEKQNYAAITIFVRLFTLLILIIPLINKYGMIGAGYAMLISVLVEIPVALFFSYKIFKK